MSGTTTTPDTTTNTNVKQEDMYQVLLHNDDHNTPDHVVRCIAKTFGHGRQLAIKIMLEAHETGVAIAEVEGETSAKLHRDQLRSSGLSSTVEKL
jgi:ATP-dependent Clp protease adaptor protein ClpS